MAEEQSNEDRTEEASPERREEFREKGQIAVSREVTSVFILASAVVFFTLAAPYAINSLGKLFVAQFEALSTERVNRDNILDFAIGTWTNVLTIILPVFLVAAVTAIALTFFQTRFNWSWKRLKPDFGRLNILKGLQRMVSLQAVMELGKGIGKMGSVGLVAYLILYSEWQVVPGLMNLPIVSTWSYWGEITQYMFWAVAGMLLIVAGADYTYNFVSLERKLKMTKQEVKDEFKKREIDPHMKARLRRMARDIATQQVLDQTKKATVLITNPTHYSIAISYEVGMDAPVVLAKGIDYLALKMREVAMDLDIPIIENRPLARELYATVEDGDEIPSNLYKAVAEVIRYVFRLKGRPVAKAEMTN